MNNSPPPVATAPSPPTLRFAVGSTVIPGDRLGSIRQVIPGPGTYVRSGNVCASLVGTLTVEPMETSGNADQENTTHQTDRGIESSRSPRASYVAVVRGSKEIASNQVLMMGDVVLGRILRITSQQAVVEILAKHHPTMGSTNNLLSYPCEGCIRREDVRTLATEEVHMQDNYLPGDVILARVLSLGDARRYLLTTAAPELGVIHALSSVSGLPMIPCSWKEMKCVDSGRVEPRKVAKPRDLSGRTVES